MGLERLGAGWVPLVEGALEALRASGAPVWKPDEAENSWALSVATYLDELVEWNQRTDLTAARTSQELVDLAVADAAIVAGSSSESRALTDVGSGAGAPGLVLSIMLPDAAVTLVEPRDKRVAFLRSAVGKLRLRNVTVARARSNALRDASCDTAVSRATLPPKEWIHEGERISRRWIWVLLATGTEPPSARRARIDVDVHYTWPLTGAPRRGVRYTMPSA